MSVIEISDGVFADEDTGELLDIPEGTDKCLLLARRLDDALSQVKAWERLAGVLKAGLNKYQTEKRAVYDDIVVSLRQNKGRSEVDPKAFRKLLEQYEVSREALLSVIEVSKVPPDVVPDSMREKCVHVGPPSKEYVILERARKRLEVSAAG